MWYVTNIFIGIYCYTWKNKDVLHQEEVKNGEVLRCRKPLEHFAQSHSSVRKAHVKWLRRMPTKTFYCSSLTEDLWVVNVDAHAARCRMAQTIIFKMSELNTPHIHRQFFSIRVSELSYPVLMFITRHCTFRILPPSSPARLLTKSVLPLM